MHKADLKTTLTFKVVEIRVYKKSFITVFTIKNIDVNKFFVVHYNIDHTMFYAQ